MHASDGARDTQAAGGPNGRQDADEAYGTLVPAGDRWRARLVRRLPHPGTRCGAAPHPGPAARRRVAAPEADSPIPPPAPPV